MGWFGSSARDELVADDGVTRPSAGAPEAVVSPSHSGGPVPGSFWAEGIRLELEGDQAGAFAAYDRARFEGELPAEPRAILRYGEALEAQGDHPGAEGAFRRAARSPEPDVSAAAWNGVHRYALRRGDVEVAQRALRAILATGDPEESPLAHRNLGTLLEDHLHDVEGARSEYVAAIASGHLLHSQGARVNLAQLVEREGRAADAAGLFREVIDSGHPLEGPRAQFLLGELLLSQGDDAEALTLFESAMQGGNEEWAARAALEAGGMYLLQLGNPQRAAEALTLAERIPDAEPAQTAAVFRGMAEQELGRETGAEAAFRRALDLLPGQATTGACLAAKNLGTMYLRRSDPAPARDLLRLAAQSEDPESSARGFLLLGLCEIQAGSPAAAAAAFEQASSTPGAPEEVHAMARQHLMSLA